METGTSFPVSVSLSRYFSDERARCFMMAPSSRNVSWLARRLRRTFFLPSRPALVCHGHLLPPGEPLTLLQPGDFIEAIPRTAPVADLSRYRFPGEEVPLTPGSKRHRSESPTPGEHHEPAQPTESQEEPDESPEPTDVTDAPSLQEMKRRALDMLSCLEAPAPRRRRVRRRRHAAPAQPEYVAVVDAASELQVIRNEGARREPHRVHALQPPTVD